MKRSISIRIAVILVLWFGGSLNAALDEKRHNVLFIISDDLTASALGCYGNEVIGTPFVGRMEC